MLKSFASCAISAFLLLGGNAHAAAFRLLLESNDNAPGGSEVFLASYSTIDDLLTGTESSAGFSDLNIAGNFSVGGLAYDGMYRLLLESNDNAAGGSELFLASFATFDDLLMGVVASSGFSSLNIAGNFSVRGFAYEFDPEMSEVPLPAAGFLFLAGLAGMSRWRRKHFQSTDNL